MHLHEIPIEHVTQWQELNPHDKVIPAVVAAPGRALTFHAPTLFDGREHREMLDFAKRANWPSAMVTVLVDPRAKAIQWVSLYRPDPDDQYSDSQKKLSQFLVRHLVEALTINRALHLQTVYDDDADNFGYVAYGDRDGTLHYADPGFVAVITIEWPQWSERRLSSALLAAVCMDRKASYAGKSIKVDAIAQDGMLFLRACRRSKLERLTPREIDVARQFGEGHSHKEVAKNLNISPSTVHHHLKVIYAKLNIHDKAELAGMFAHHKRD